MKNKLKPGFILLVAIFATAALLACPLCEKQQPEITRGITHGTGPQSNWDWVIIAVISIITLFTLIASLKYLIKPGEKNINHIKQSILNH